MKEKKTKRRKSCRKKATMSNLLLHPPASLRNGPARDSIVQITFQ